MCLDLVLECSSHSCFRFFAYAKDSKTDRSELGSCKKVEVAVLGLPVPNSPYGLCGRKATLDFKKKMSPIVVGARKD